MTTAERKNKYYSTKCPDGPWDDIVIGSGMGGMISAALLAELGRRVLVLEQHYVPGGFTHTFRRKKYEWDVGVHAIGQVTDRFVVGRLLQKLTRGKLQWASLGPTYDEFYFPGDFRIEFPDNREQFRHNLHAAFPEERRAIDQYLHLVREAAGAARGHFGSQVLPQRLARLAGPILRYKADKVFLRTTDDVLDGITQNERLRTVLTSQWGYYGSPPDRASFGAHALVVKHFWYGGHYPQGGSSMIAESLLSPVCEGGGAVRIRASVKEIMVKNGAAVGVRLDSGEELTAQRVFSAAGAVNTVQQLLPQAQRHEPWAKSIGKLTPAPAHVCLYLAFKGDIRQAGAGSANKWFYERWDQKVEAWDYRDPQAEAPILYCSFPSLKDPNYNPGPEQLHTGEVVTFLPWDDFAKYKDSRWQKRGEEYEGLKEELAERLLAQFLRHNPGLKPYLDKAELSTPTSTVHFTRATHGSIYGLEPNVERFACTALRPRTPIKNLYMSGCDVGMVGVIGAMMGGVLSVLAAEPVKTFRILRDVS